MKWSTPDEYQTAHAFKSNLKKNVCETIRSARFNGIKHMLARKIKKQY